MTTVSQAETLRPLAGEPRSLPRVGNWNRTLLSRAWSAVKWIMQRATAQQARKNLRICETVSLGDKRFVAVLQVDEERFLIGGSSSTVSLLTRLQEAETFAADLKREADKLS